MYEYTVLFAIIVENATRVVLCLLPTITVDHVHVFCILQGDNIKKFREESGAKINISDSTCPERIVTITGPTESILKAFSLICAKFEEMSQLNNGMSTDPALNGVHGVQGLHGKPLGPGQTAAPVTLRLVVPASQCGSLIGELFFFNGCSHIYMFAYLYPYSTYPNLSYCHCNCGLRAVARALYV